MAIARLAAPPLASAMAIIQPDRKPINQLARQHLSKQRIATKVTLRVVGLLPWLLGPSRYSSISRSVISSGDFPTTRRKRRADRR